MVFKILSKLAGDSNERELSRLEPVVDAINGLEPEFEALSDTDLRNKTNEFRARLDEGESLDYLIPDAFAAVREAAKRTLGQRHYDVQLMGGMVLHSGRVAEMKTGEGKTLVATLPMYLNALTGRGAHLVTVNDYLAKRDTQWMGPIYHLLGLTVACLQHDTAYLFNPASETEDPSLNNLTPVSRQEAYEADITYGTNNEFGFDYLRDNMVQTKAQMVQQELHFAIVDEVDNILIDEARTPLIISGEAAKSPQAYQTMARLVPQLEREKDYTIDEKSRSVSLTQDGITRVEAMLKLSNLYDPQNYALTHYLENALRAYAVYQRDVDYMVKDREAIIVDEFTGRLMEGRRYSDGLHQAIEAKEGLQIKRESITLATITLQNYFRLYEKLAGMTGTAVTESEEFYKIYTLDVVTIPTHMPMVRGDQADQIFKSEEGKYQAVVRDVEELHNEGAPVLIGTASVERSEHLSKMMTKAGIVHQVLNAKHHEREAMIVSQAGRIGAVTVATNMAGRGTDIILGGRPDGRVPQDWQDEHDKVVELGGLHIIGTERHEARRIDNQLRGRSGRQGDPGGSRFYISLEDELMRRFGGDKIKSIMGWAGIEDDAPVEHRWINKSVESAQTKVEGYNFDIRKRLVEYDDVANNHREVIYNQRRLILQEADLKANIKEMIETEIVENVYGHLSDEHGDDWDVEGLIASVLGLLPLPPEINAEKLAELSRTEIEELLLERAESVYQALEEKAGPDAMRAIERAVMFRSIDTHWVDHLTAMEQLRQGIFLQAYGQRDPLVAFKRQGHEMFQELTARIRTGIVRTIFHIDVRKGANGQQAGPGQMQNGGTRMKPATVSAQPAGEAKQGTSSVALGKVGRNDPCPCGSGKKYKRCHGG